MDNRTRPQAPESDAPSREYDPQPVIHVPGWQPKPHPKRELYDASMAEYRRAREWWDAAEPEERDYYSKVDCGLTWTFLSGVERWTIVRDLLNAGDQAIADRVPLATRMAS